MEDVTAMKDMKTDMPRRNLAAMLRREADRQASAHALRSQIRSGDEQAEFQNPAPGIPTDAQAGNLNSQADNATQHATELDDDTLARLDFLSCLFANTPLAD